MLRALTDRPGMLSEGIDERLGHAVGQVLELGIAGRVDEGQDRDRLDVGDLNQGRGEVRDDRECEHGHAATDDAIVAARDPRAGGLRRSPVVCRRLIFSPNSRSCRSALRSASISVIAG